MGISDEVYRLFAEKLGKSVKDLTISERKAAESVFSSGQNSVESDNTSTKTVTSSPSTIQASTATPAGAGNLLGLFSDVKQGLLGSIGPLFDFKTIGNDLNALITEAQNLGNEMGIGRARAGELRTTIADTLPEMVKLGISTTEGMSTIKEIPNALKTNATIANETIVELAATSKFAGADVGTLVKEFSSVGTQLSSVGDEMASVANYAKSIGVNVQEVTKGVVGNLKQLNLFNFENGVQGLAKMQAQSAMLGVNMDKVFTKADSLLNPESAIEFSSALQRLGVASTELLDPLSAMDMALNDPAKLQDEMTKVAKQFTRLKADGTGFEILPGAKLQLREVAKELGMSADELAGMAIKSSDLDMKLKQIRFPSFAASEEDRMLIANMSQMKDGRAVVQIEEGGEKKEVAVEDLTAQQLEKLKKDQAEQAMSAEDLARSQLTVQQEIKGILEGTELATRMGVVSQKPLQRLADASLEFRGAAARNLFGEKITTKSVRKATTGISAPLEEAGTQLISGGFTTENLNKVQTTLNELPKNIVGTLGNFLTGGAEGLRDTYKDALAGVTSIYEGVGGIQKINASNVSTGPMDEIITIMNNITTEAKNTVSKIFKVEQTVDFTNSDGSLQAVDSDVLNKAYNHMMFKLPNSPEDLRKLDEGFKSVTTGP